MSFLIAIQAFARAAWAIKWVRYALATAALLSALTYWHNSRVDAAVKQYAATRDAADLAILAQAKVEAQAATDANAAAILAAQQKAFNQGQTDEKTIQSLRADLRNGTRILRQYATCSGDRNANIGTALAASDASSRAAASGSVDDSERIVRLGEIALTALNNWQEAQAVIVADREALK